MKINQLFLNSTLFVTGVGDIGLSLNTGPKAKYPDLTIEPSTDPALPGFFIKVKGKEAFIGIGNVRHALIER